MSGKFPDEMKCPVCLGIPQIEIFQCINGHIVCHACGKILINCPQCRVVFENPKIRSRALENLLDMMKFDCKYKSQGCNDQLSRTEYYIHAEQCHFGGYLTKLCERLGYLCDFQASTKGGTKTLDHFSKVHGMPWISNSNRIIVELAPWSSLKNNNRFWKPVIWELSKIVDFKLLLVFLYNEKDKFASVLPIELNETSAVSKSSRINFRIDPVNPSMSDGILWSVPAVKIQHAGDRINRPFFQLPVDTLEKEYIKDDKLVLHCWESVYTSVIDPKCEWPKVISNPIEKIRIDQATFTHTDFQAFASSVSTLASAETFLSSYASSKSSTSNPSTDLEAVKINNQNRTPNDTGREFTPQFNYFGNFTPSKNTNWVGIFPVIQHSTFSDGKVQTRRVFVSRTSFAYKRGTEGKTDNSESPQEKKGRSDEASSV